MGRAGEDLEQLATVVLVDQDVQLAQRLHRDRGAAEPLGQAVVVGARGAEELDAVRAGATDGGGDVAGAERQVLDARAVVVREEGVDLAGPAAGVRFDQGEGDVPGGALHHAGVHRLLADLDVLAEDPVEAERGLAEPDGLRELPGGHADGGVVEGLQQFAAGAGRSLLQRDEPQRGVAEADDQPVGPVQDHGAVPLGPLQHGLRVGAAERQRGDALAVPLDVAGHRMVAVPAGPEPQSDAALVEVHGLHPGRRLGLVGVAQEAEAGLELGGGLRGVRAVVLDTGDRLYQQLGS